MRLFASIALSALLAGCAAQTATAPIAPSHVPVAVTIAMGAVDRADIAYARAKFAVELLVPVLPPHHVTRIREVQAIIERALAAARMAVTVADQLAALAAARDGMIHLTGIADPG